MKVLFVCLGNICRSPLAEGIFKKQLEDNNLKHISCDSAGTAAYHIGKLPDERSRAVAQKNNINLNHQARQFKVEDFNQFDLIIAMDRANLKDIESLRPPNNQTPVKLMRSYIVSNNLDVPDPYYGDINDFISVYKLLDDCAAQLIAEIK